MVNVLFISSGSDNSGSSHSLVTLAAILKENYNINLTVVLARRGPIEEQLKKNKVNYYILKHYNWIRSNIDKLSFSQLVKRKIKIIFNYIGEKRLDRLIKRKNIDIIHINTISTGFGSITALENDKILVWHIREFMDLDLNYEFINSNKSIKLINKSDAIIAISESIKNHFSAKLDSTKIVRIYNGIKEENYNGKYNTVLESKLITLTIAGRLTEPKGQIDAIKAINILVKKGYKVKLQIIGDGDEEYQNKLKHFVVEKNIENEVEFLGYIPNIHDIWTNTDIALICSKAEAFGRVTVEAMMGGAIVIGANTKGTSELIDNKYGYTYKQGDFKNLSEVIEYAIKNKEESRNIANLGRQYALESFTANKNAENIYNLYKKLLNNKSKK